MNGIILLCTAVGLASGPDTTNLTEVVPLGTGGTVLSLPSGTRWEFKQVQTPAGPRIRLTYGRQAVYGRVVRWSTSRGTVYTSWTGLNGPYIDVRPAEPAGSRLAGDSGESFPTGESAGMMR